MSEATRMNQITDGLSVNGRLPERRCRRSSSWDRVVKWKKCSMHLTTNHNILMNTFITFVTVCVSDDNQMNLSLTRSVAVSRAAAVVACNKVKAG